MIITKIDTSNYLHKTALLELVEVENRTAGRASTEHLAQAVASVWKSVGAVVVSPAEDSMHLMKQVKGTLKNNDEVVLTVVQSASRIHVSFNCDA